MVTKIKKPVKNNKPLPKKAVVKKPASSAVLLDSNGKKVGTISLPHEVFDVPMNKALISQVVRVYLANRRQPSALVKTRGDVNGSRRKIWRQKGTGRARHSDRYAPIFVGGGVAHGPKKRDFGLKLSQSMRKKALAMSLTEKNTQGSIVFVSHFDEIKPQTKSFMTMVKQVGCPVRKGKLTLSALFVISANNASLYRASKNVQDAKIETASLVTTYDLMRYRTIVIEKNAIELLKKRVTL